MATPGQQRHPVAMNGPNVVRSVVHRYDGVGLWCGLRSRVGAWGCRAFTLGHKWSGVDTPLSSSRACPTAFTASPVPVHVPG